MDGPHELHIVVLDGGRSQLLADPHLREALHCIRCGACMNVCPVYRNVGGHAYGSVYPGPIGIVVSPTFYSIDSTSTLPFASSLCGACGDVCPVRIDLPKLILRNRARVIRRGNRKLLERMAMRIFRMTMMRHERFALAGRLFRIVAPLLRDEKDGGLRVPVWTRSRYFPGPPPRPFRELWKERHNERP